MVNRQRPGVETTTLAQGNLNNVFIKKVEELVHLISQSSSKALPEIHKND